MQQQTPAATVDAKYSVLFTIFIHRYCSVSVCAVSSCELVTVRLQVTSSETLTAHKPQDEGRYTIRLRPVDLYNMLVTH